MHATDILVIFKKDAWVGQGSDLYYRYWFSALPLVARKGDGSADVLRVRARLVIRLVRYIGTDGYGWYK